MTASKIKIKKVCEWCGQEFLALKVSTRFCSKQCNGHAYKDANRKKVLLETERETLEKVSQNNISQGLNREFMSVAEAATLLGVTRMTIYNLIYNNVLHASKITSRLTFVSRSDIDAMISGNKSCKWLRIRLRDCLGVRPSTFSFTGKRSGYIAFGVQYRATPQPYVSPFFETRYSKSAIQTCVPI